MQEQARPPLKYLGNVALPPPQKKLKFGRTWDFEFLVASNTLPTPTFWSGTWWERVCGD